MRLKTVSLRNFRCFESLEVELHPRLTVFVGENGGGKTAILDAIAIALSPVLRHFSSANQRLVGPGIKDTDFRIESVTGRAGKERWGASDYAQVVAETTDGLRWDHWRASTPGKQPETKVGWGELATFSEGVLNSLKTAAPSLMPVFAYYGAQRGRIEIPARLRASREDYSQPTAAFVGALDALSDFRSMLQWFDWMEAAELRANKGHAPEDTDENPALAAVRATIREILGGVYTNPYFNAEHKFVLDQASGAGALQVSQLSQGYQSMLALGMDFARRLAIANSHLNYSDEASLETLFRIMHDVYLRPLEGFAAGELQDAPAMCAPAIMLVDEIDLHLHPSWQQRVLGDLMRTFPATQFIVSTHSPQVLSSVHRENIRTVGFTADGRNSAPTPLANSYGEQSGDVLQSIMLVDPFAPIQERGDIQRLTELVDQGAYDSAEAVTLFERLRNALGTEHSELQRLDRSIRRQKALKS